MRWGQTNLTEIDPQRFDLPWWRGHWRRTCVQGVVVNAGGIVAYYPTKVPFHRRAEFLGGRDLFGEILRAAHEDGLAVFARMDSNRAGGDMYGAHPDWFARDGSGNPYRVTNLYVACVNSPYYTEHIPAILREVAIGYRPEGFTDNNWNGPMRDQPCFCENCRQRFHERTGRDIPPAADWNDPLYRDWIRWNYERRIEIWDLFNSVAREAGGKDCIWVGMMAGSQSWQSRVFRDDREILRRADMIMLDDQRRSDLEGFQHNGQVGKRLRCVAGWEKVVPESMAMYNAAEHGFRLASKPEPEARMWVLEGIAGGVQPWWHHIGSQRQDRRMFKTAEPLWRWHRDHEEFLVNRLPVASVGMLWSQRNMDFFGRDNGGVLVDEPWNGFTQALVRARIPCLPVHIDDLERDSRAFGLRVIILPGLAAMSDAQVSAVRRFLAGGGSIVATGPSSLFDLDGVLRRDFALADRFGAHVPSGHAFRNEARRTAWARDFTQTYLRLEPGRADETGGAGPLGTGGARHVILRGFEDTDILGFGGMLEPLDLDPGGLVPLTFVPAMPNMPVEAAWMREPLTRIPGIVLRESPEGGRIAYMPADIDRRFARENQPDHGNLLANVVRWAAKDDIPLKVDGPGLIDVHLYRQPSAGGGSGAKGNGGRLVLHLVNLTSAGTWRSPVHELIPVGPLKVAVRLPADIKGGRVRSIVYNDTLNSRIDDGWVHFEIAPIADHEVVVIG
jgi:hypothetical protein